ncbi:MAG: calcium/sodium antiporter [Firmicutes bacterium]|nr:calcium/sodium antiporter [Bacillota bacterium]
MIIINMGILVAGFVLLIEGADFFVKGASTIARKFGVPQIVIGLTVVAMGTSAPEAAVSIAAAISGNADITIGNVVGSNIMNIFVILGITALVAPIAIDRSTVKVDIPFMLGVSILLIPLGLTGEIVLRWEGLLLLTIFAAYMIYLFRQAFKASNKSDDTRPTYGQGSRWMFLWTVVGLAMIVLGSKCIIYSASEIALELGVSQRMIALTIVAFGTSLPELVTSVTAARRGNPGLAIGNIVGSNLFNILFVTGLTAVITPIAFQHAFIIDSAIAAFAALLLWLFALKSGRLGRIGGAVMLVCYAAYFAFILFLK